MFKTILLLIGCAALLSCTKQVSEIGYKYPLPEAMKDCQVYQSETGTGSSIVFVRCPHSTTTTKMSDKAGTTTVVDDQKPI